MDGAAQRMLQSRARRGSPGIFTGILIATAVSMLPMCDACDEAQAASAFSGLGLSSGGTTSALVPCLLWLAVAAAIVFVVAKASAVPARALPIVILGVVVAGWMVCSSSMSIARTRSNAVDSWPTCYDRGDATGGGEPMFDGPHFYNGEPCVLASEDRPAHARAHPNGDVADGIHQILYRFRQDQARVVYLPLALLTGLVVSLVLAVVATLRSRAPNVQRAQLA